MNLSLPDLIAAIAKGTRQSKLQAYRLLLIQYGADVKASSAMTRKLIKEPNAWLFKDVMELDQSTGPRLDWPHILDKRLQQCKNNDARYDAIHEKYDYGPNQTDILARVALEDEEERHRAWALQVLLRKNEDTTDPYFFELIMACIKRDPLTARTRPNSIYEALWYLGYSQLLYDFIVKELETEMIPVSAKGLGSIINRYPENYAPLIQRIQQLCEAQFGCESEGWKDIKPVSKDQSHTLCQLLITLLSHGVWDDAFIIYVVSLADGPMLQVAEQLRDVNDPGWKFYRQLSAYLAFKHKNKMFAAELLLKLLENKSIPALERWLMTPFYANLQFNRGLSQDEVRQTLSHLLNKKNKQYRDKVNAYFDQDDKVREAALSKQEEERLDRVKRGVINETIVSFVKFILPTAFGNERQTYMQPLWDNVHQNNDLYNGETVNGEVLFSLLCSMQNNHDKSSYVISHDSRDREFVAEMVDISRTILQLPIDDDVYKNDEDYSLNVFEQYQLYDVYLQSKGFKLVYIYPGCDDFSAVVIALSKKGQFIDFMKTSLPDLDYGF